jgi:hypothetical protein
MTNKVLKIEELTEHVLERFREVLRDVEQTLGTKIRPLNLTPSNALSGKWTSLVEFWVNPKKSLRGATWSMFDALVPAPTRTACNLPLPRP